MFKISIEPEEIEKMPQGAFPGKIHVIEKNGLEYAKAVAYLMRQKVIGFDTETRPVFTPGHPHHHVALLQLSGPDRAYLFRLNKMGLRKLVANVLANPSITKVGAAVHDDVRGLQYHRRFEPNGFVDLQKIAYLWGIRDKSVKKMAAIIMECKISKTQQLSNWEADKLSAAQQMYAATDAWICREMYIKLMASEKHPLTPELLAPQQPQQPDKTPKETAPAPKESVPAPKKKRPARKKTASKPAAEAPKEEVKSMAEGDARKPHSRRRHHHSTKKKTDPTVNGKDNS